MAELYRINKSTLEDLADTVRTATGQTGPISFDQIEAVAKESIIISNGGTSGGGTDTSDATATAADIFAGETAYTADGKVTGTFTIDSELSEQSDLISQISTLVATKATPSGTDTSDATATAGDILSGKTAYVKGSKVTGTIPSKAAATYTPTTSNQTISSGTYLTGTQTIKGDSNLVAGNIKSGVSIFGVTGTATAAEDLDAELTTQEGLIQQLSTILDSKASGGGSGGVEVINVTINAEAAAAGFYYTDNYGSTVKAESEGTYPCPYGLCYINDTRVMIDKPYAAISLPGGWAIKALENLNLYVKPY